MHFSKLTLPKFFQVINETILKDYQKSIDDVATIQKDLRAERFRLMKDTAKEKLNRDLVINYDDIGLWHLDKIS